jgi:uncharacterized membrane protein YkvA (DUF1232 family)
MPMDLIPDYIPFLGQIDDLYLLALALDRLLNNAGVDVLLEHWEGERQPGDGDRRAGQGGELPPRPGPLAAPAARGLSAPAGAPDHVSLTRG